jgi:tRNA-dihydrouridine synthase
MSTLTAPVAANDRGASGIPDRVTTPLRIGSLELDVPVVLAPMAGITNTAFRRLCREYGAGLYVSEMITSRALVERTPESPRRHAASSCTASTRRRSPRP